MQHAATQRANVAAVVVAAAAEDCVVEGETIDEAVGSELLAACSAVTVAIVNNLVMYLAANCLAMGRPYQSRSFHCWVLTLPVIDAETA